jgi:hypothetical protein
MKMIEIESALIEKSGEGYSNWEWVNDFGVSQNPKSVWLGIDGNFYSQTTEPSSLNDDGNLYSDPKLFSKLEKISVLMGDTDLIWDDMCRKNPDFPLLEEGVVNGIRYRTVADGHGSVDVLIEAKNVLMEAEGWIEVPNDHELSKFFERISLERYLEEFEPSPEHSRIDNNRNHKTFVAGTLNELEKRQTREYEETQKKDQNEKDIEIGQKVIFHLKGKGSAIQGCVVDIDENSLTLRSGEQKFSLLLNMGDIEILPFEPQPQKEPTLTLSRERGMER